MDTRRTIAGGCIPDARRGKRTRSTLLVLIKTRPCSYRLTTLLNQVDGSLHSELATFVGGGRRANRSIPPYQPESEIGGRFSDRTSAQAYVADEIGHVCAMASFHNPNAPICARDCLLASVTDSNPNKAAVGPLPNIARDIEQSIFVCAEAPGGPRHVVNRVVRELALVTGKPTLSRIAAIDVRPSLAAKLTPCCESPLPVCRKA